MHIGKPYFFLIRQICVNGKKAKDFVPFSGVFIDSFQNNILF